MNNKVPFHFSKLRAILIDLDGTLADSLPVLYESYLQFLKVHGFEGSQEEFNSIIGPSLDEIVNILKEKYDIQESSEFLRERYQAIIDKFYASEVQLYPGAKEFLKKARRQGLKLALVTSAPSNLVTQLLSTHSLLEHFDLIITPNGMHKSKPNPEIYQRTIALLDIHESEALAIEDSPQGVQAAISAGIFAIQLTHGKPGVVNEKVIAVNDWFEILQLSKLYG